MAIVDDGAATSHGFGTGSASTSSARLCAQFCYDPYGTLLSVQGLHAFPDPRTGHKGLHLDRLDAGVADPLTGAPIARHTVGATHAYFVRNRHYSPDLGRFLQRDPNQTALQVLSSADLGVLPGTVGVLGLVGHVSDGLGVYTALRSSPLRGADPFGLEFSLVQVQSTSATSGYLATSSAAQMSSWAALGSSSYVAGGSLGATLGFGASTTATVSGVKAAMVWLLAGAVAIGPTGAFVIDHFLSTDQGDDSVGGHRLATETNAQHASNAFLARYLSGSGGRWGSNRTRRQLDYIARRLESEGWKVEFGAGRGSEEHIRGPGGGNRGGTFVDLTATRDGTTLRIQTVDTLPNGQPTPREAAAAARIRAAFPRDKLRLIPKQ